MNFNNSNDNKWIALFIVFALIILGSIGFAAVQTYAALDSSRKEMAKSQKQLDELRKIAANRVALESKIKFTKAEFDSYSHALPKEIFQENIVDMLRDFAQKSGMQLLDVDLNPVENNDAGFKITAKIAFAGSYTQIADFLGMANSSIQKTVVSQMTIAGKGKSLTGSATVMLYGYKDSSYSQPLWSSTLPEGKPDLFKLYEGAPDFDATPPPGASTAPGQTVVAPQTGVSPYDIFLVSGPTSDDAPTTVLGKNNVAGSELFADGNTQNWVNLFITEKNGKMFYRYRTSFGEYPDSNKTEEFVPVVSGKVIVKVTAKPKINPEDRAGAVLNVYNFTNREVVVKVNQQTGIPRVSVVQKFGSETTVYE